MIKKVWPVFFIPNSNFIQESALSLNSSWCKFMCNLLFLFPKSPYELKGSKNSLK